MSRPQVTKDLLDEFRSRFHRIRALSHKLTYFPGTYTPSIAPVTFVIGFPRSGTTWITSLVSEVLGLPYVEASLTPLFGPCVYHGHERAKEKYDRAVYVLRDGRDIMVSLYFHLWSGTAAGVASPEQMDRWYGDPEDPEDVAARMPEFIEDQMNDPHGRHPNWPEHVRSYFETQNRDMCLIRYEDMLKEPIEELKNALESSFVDELDREWVERAVRKYDFERTSGRSRGEEEKDAFQRKGVSGDWRNYFNSEAAETFDQYAGDTLVKAGYESSRSWIDTVG